MFEGQHLSHSIFATLKANSPTVDVKSPTPSQSSSSSTHFFGSPISGLKQSSMDSDNCSVDGSTTASSVTPNPRNFQNLGRRSPLSDSEQSTEPITMKRFKPCLAGCHSRLSPAMDTPTVACRKTSDDEFSTTHSGITCASPTLTSINTPHLAPMKGESLPSFSLDEPAISEPQSAVFSIEKKPTANKRQITKLEKESKKANENQEAKKEAICNLITAAKLRAKHFSGKCLGLTQSAASILLAPQLASHEQLLKTVNFKFECAAGHSFEAVIGASKWCIKCDKNVKRLIELARSKGGKVLLPRSSNSPMSVELECEQGHRWSLDLCSRQAQSTTKWCSVCKRLSREAERNKREAENKKIEQEYLNLQQEMLRQARFRMQRDAFPIIGVGDSTSSKRVCYRLVQEEVIRRGIEQAVTAEARRKTLEYMSSAEYEGTCSYEDVLIVYRILLASEQKELNVQDLLVSMSTAKEPATAFRKIALLVHPDKNRHPQANQAFQKLKSAFVPGE